MKSDVVYIVDDDDAVRGSLAWLLEGNGFKVSVHENGERFLKALEGADRSTPICVLLDLNLPGMSGLEVQAKLARKYPAIPVAFITGFGQIATAVKALQQGAVDFIEKPFDEKKLIELVNKMLNQAFAKIKEVDELKAVVDNFKKLTPREKQVLDCIVGGKINKAIAEFLGISIKTVEAHRASVMEKLGVSRPAGLIQVAHLFAQSQKHPY